MISRAALTVTLLLLLQSIGQGQDHAWRIRYSGDIVGIGINPLNPNTVFAKKYNMPVIEDSLLVSFNRGVTWNFLGILGGHSGFGILVHPVDTLVMFDVFSPQDLRRSSDYGLTWTTVLSPSSDVESIVIDPVLPDNMYAGVHDGDIYRSSDRGTSWELFSFVDSVLCDLAIRPDSTNILYAGTGGGLVGKIWKSTNEGLSWRVTATTTESLVSHIAIDFYNPSIAYATSADGPQQGVLRTSDWGEHWGPVLTGYHGWYVDIDRGSPATVYVADDYGAAPVKSTNEGVSWESMEPGLPGDFSAWGIMVHPLPDIIWYAPGGGIYRWAPLVSAIGGMVLDDETGMPVTNGFVELASTGERVMLDTSSGSYSFHYYEDDPGMNTTLHVEAFPYYLHDEPIEFVDSSIVRDIHMTRLLRTSLAGTAEDSISHSPLSAEVTLLATTSLGSVSYTAVTDLGGSFHFDSLYVSYPPIISYGSIVVTPGFPHAHLVVSPVILDTTSYVLNALLDTADVLITSSLGSGDFTEYYTATLDSLGLQYYIWSPLAEGLAPLSKAVEMRKGMAIYYTGNDSAPLTNDELDSMSTALQLGVHMFITGQNFIESNDSSDLVSQVLGVSHAGNTQTFISACKGVSNELLSDLVFFTAGGTGANNQTSRDIIQIEDSLAIPVLDYGTSGTFGIAAIRRDNIGAGARVVLFGFGFEAINAHTMRETVLQAIVGYLDGSIVLDVADHNRGDLPLTFRLEQNYPNPFNPRTDVRYEISDVGFVRLVVYDILGREVATLVNERKAPGRYSVTWDASGQASGVYFYKLQAGNFTETKKLVLLR